MSSAWSVFAVPASELEKVPSALKGVQLTEGKLFVGRTLRPVAGAEPWVAFGIEHQGWRFIEPVSDDDLPSSFFQAFTRIVSIYGASNTDSVSVTQYVRGQARLRRDTCYGESLYPLVKLLGFDVISLGRYGGFGVSPPELSGATYLLDAPLPVLDGSERTAAALPEPLDIEASIDDLKAASGTDAAAKARWALALVYRDIGLDEGLWVLSQLRSSLEPGTPEAEATRALLAMVDR